jgi:hypothetical protein
MAWWDFVADEKYNLNEVVGKIHSHIREDKKIKAKPDKLRLLKQIENCGHSVIVYSPNKSGWGISPMNPKCWRTVKGAPIV